jgi:hypothetical protein
VIKFYEGQRVRIGVIGPLGTVVGQDWGSFVGVDLDDGRYRILTPRQRQHIHPVGGTA